MPSAPASHGRLLYRLLLPPVARLRAVPFLGLTVIHRRGALSVAWTMWSTTDFHRKSTARGESDRSVHGHNRVLFVISQVSRFVRSVGLQIFQDEESFIRLYEKIVYQ